MTFRLTIRRYFNILANGEINKNGSNYINNVEKYKLLLDEMNKVKNKILDGGGDRAKVRHQQNNKKLVEDRLRLLFDNDYYEYGFYVGYGQSYGDIPRAGCVCAIGKINNRYCATITSDASVKAGTIFPIQLRKQLRLYELAENCRLPVIFVVDSGGAFLPLQSEIFPDKDHGGRVFYNLAYLQSLGLPVITLVCGSCTAGAAYIPTMSSEAGMISGTGHIFLGGPPLVKAAIGEIISAEDLGGSRMHSSISGCSDYHFETEDEGLKIVRDIVQSFPQQNHYQLTSPHFDFPCSPLYDVNDLDYLLINQCNEAESRKELLYQILSRLVDKSCFHEFKTNYGKGLITGFAKLEGFTVGLIGCYDSLSEEGCLKASHFIQLCNQRQLVMISLIHTSLEDENNRIKNGNINNSSPNSIIKAKSSMLRSLATRKTKLITIVIGDSVSPDSYCLGGDYLNSELNLAWINARFGYDESSLNDSKLSNALMAGGFMVVDDIIKPSDTRTVVAQFLKIINTDSNLSTDTSNIPIYRF